MEHILKSVVSSWVPTLKEAVPPPSGPPLSPSGVHLPGAPPHPPPPPPLPVEPTFPRSDECLYVTPDLDTRHSPDVRRAGIPKRGANIDGVGRGREGMGLMYWVEGLGRE